MGALAMCWHRLAFPATFNADAVVGFARRLAMRPLYGWARQPDPVVCETVATVGGLVWQLGLSAREAPLLVPQLHALGVSVEPIARQLPPLSYAVELTLDGGDVRPARTDIAETVAAALITALSGVADGEAVVLSWLVGPPLPRPALEPGDLLDPNDDPLTSPQVRALDNKHAEPTYGAVARIGIATGDAGRGVQLAQGVLGALALAEAPGTAFAVRWVGGRQAARRLVAHHGPLWAWPVTINAAELASVIGWPAGNPHAPGVTYRGGRQLPPTLGTWVPEATANAAPAGRYRTVGAVSYPGHGGYMHLPITDALRHLWLIGPTGAGKSALLTRMIGADIAAGRSVVIVEPKGDLIEDVIDRIPPSRTGDVVLIDPTDPTHAVGFNVLAGNPELAADRFCALCEGLWPGAWGPRTAQLIHAACLTLARAGATLADLPYLLTNHAYRAQLVSTHPDPLGVGPVWEEYDALSDSGRSGLAGPALSRLAAFTTRPSLRAMIAQPSPRFALDDILTRPRIVCVNAAVGAIGPESARLLGAMVLAQLWQATQERAITTPPGKRSPVALYVDELANYVRGFPVDFGEVLGLARGLGLALTVAHQTLGQLDSTTRSGVMANARSRVVFQTNSTEDARALADTLGSDLTPGDLAALPPYHAYAALVADGATRPAASLTTLPPTPHAGPPAPYAPSAAAAGQPPSPRSRPPSSPAARPPTATAAGTAAAITPTAAGSRPWWADAGGTGHDRHGRRTL